MTDPANKPSSDQSQGNIKVVCRFRPMNDRELSMNTAVCVDFSTDRKTVSMLASDSGPLKFTFDAVFPPDSHQADVYEFAARPTVESVLEGFNGTVFAYGQTGSGKTFTMSGPDVDDSVLKGVIPRMVATVFSTISSASDDLEFSVKVGYAEIYMERIKDLLEPTNANLKIHEDKSRGVYIAGLTEEYVSSEAEVYSLMKLGSANREVGATLMNEGSSRSHSLFLMTISQNNKVDFSAKIGKLYLVDLAGSEKVGKTGAEGKRLDEAKQINKSLSTLGLVINSLTDGKSTHVPYRDSKLTRVLQDSLGGNSKTTLIVTCSPSTYNESETVSTLRFGIRAKAIKNKPKINREFSIAELKLLLAKSEAEVLKRDTVIAVLKKRLLDAGGTLPSEQDLAEFRDVQEEGKVESQSSEMEELTQEMDRLRDIIETLRRTESQLSVAVDTEKTANIRLSAELEELKLKISSMNLKLMIVQEEGKDKEHETVRLKLQSQGLEEELNRVSMQIGETDIRTEKTDAVSVTSETSDVTEALESKEKDIRDLRRRLDQYESLIRSIETSTGEASVIRLCEAQHHLDPELLSDSRNLLEDERVKTRKLTDENAELQKQLNAALSSIVPDYESLLTARVEALLNSQQRRWEHNLSVVQRDLANRIDKVVQLELELDNERETNAGLVNTLSGGDKGVRKHVQRLEKENQEINVKFHRLLNERRTLASDLGNQQDKCHRLEQSLHEAESNLEIAFSHIEELQQRIGESHRETEEIRSRQSIKSLNISQHMKKVIKGGNKSSPTKAIVRSPFEFIPEEYE